MRLEVDVKIACLELEEIREIEDWMDSQDRLDPEDPPERGVFEVNQDKMDYQDQWDLQGTA